MKIKSILITVGIIVGVVGVIGGLITVGVMATNDPIKTAFPPGAAVSLKDMDITGNIGKYTENNDQVEILVRDKHGNNQTITVNENLLVKP